MTTPQSALADLEGLKNTQEAVKLAKLHMVDRPYLGVTNPQIDVLYKAWRTDTDLSQRVLIATHLWDSNIHEARIAAAKLLTQARINPDGDVWDEIARWVTSFDVAALADHACSAGARRLSASPDRLDTVEAWTTHDNIWVRRAALMITLPLAKLNYPSDADLAARDRILGWAAVFVADPNPDMQKAIALWLRTLSKHDKPRAKEFLDEYGEQMKAFAFKEASALL